MLERQTYRRTCVRATIVRSCPGCFAAVLADGRVLVRAIRQPLFDGARALAAEGVRAETVITARHCGSAIIAMRPTVGEASRWTVEESDRGGLRKPFENARSSQGGSPKPADEELAGMFDPETPVARPEAA